MYCKQKWSSRRVVKIMCPCATPLGTYFPEKNLVHCTAAADTGHDPAYEPDEGNLHVDRTFGG